MRVIHELGGNKIQKEVPAEAGFLLTNKIGDYFSLPASPYFFSRYHGWFVFLGGEMHKIIENLEIEGEDEMTEIKNNFWNIEIKKKNIKEKFFLAPESHSLIYENSSASAISLILDVKKSYNNYETGHYYEIFKEEGVIVVKYIQEGQYAVYLAVKSETSDYSLKQKWFSKQYPLDIRRRSWPFERFVYAALTLKSGKIVFSAALDKNEAIENAKKVFENSQKLKSEKKKEILIKVGGIKGLESIADLETKMAYLCAFFSLDGLTVERGGLIGIYAGLPWFFQFWARDEAISLTALKSWRRKDVQKIIMRHLDSANQGGRLAEKFADSGDKNSADALGWLFQRIGQIVFDTDLNSKFFNKHDLEKIADKLKEAIDGLLGHHTFDELDVCGGGETWMDAINRGGARIEIQALRAYLYKLAFYLTGDKKYLALKICLIKKLLEKFWNGEILADGLGDFTMRPNLFLAAYIFPELLDKEEWKKCFDNALSCLWLEWGGLSTIDRYNYFFITRHSGENSQSYHSGDSWFYLNNLAAITLYECDKERYDDYVSKIIKVSSDDILWRQVVGHHSELSSAVIFSPAGCWAQSWSAALYIELINKVFKI